jgi:hypothetical protein
VTVARWPRLLLLWLVTGALLWALYATGRTRYHRYEDMAGWGLNRDRYVGKDLSDELRDGASYRYVGIRRVFEGDPGPRVFAAAVIVPVALLLSVRWLRPPPSPTPPPESPPPA